MSEQRDEYIKALIEHHTARRRLESEIAEARLRGIAWWTIGFEATGSADTLRTTLEATAALVFAQPLPGWTVLAAADSYSYAQWLTRQASPVANAEP